MYYEHKEIFCQYLKIKSRCFKILSPGNYTGNLSMGIVILNRKGQNLGYTLYSSVS